MSSAPLRVAYLNCAAGISGDMFLGALLHAAVPKSVMDEAVSKLHIGASLETESVLRSGIAALKAWVLTSDEVAESALSPHEHPHNEELGVQPGARPLSMIQSIIRNANLHPLVEARALAIFQLLGETEARIHDVAVEAIHFHEVGAVDAIVDIVAAAAGIHHLQVEAWCCSPVNVGSGMVTCAHGQLPVPAPATAELLRGMPTYAAHVERELTTPTGAAILRSLHPAFGPQPMMTVERIGYGAGKRNPDALPNVLRLSVGTSDDFGMHPAAGGDLIAILETAVDDLSPQTLAYAAERALALGALDVMMIPALMKKGRPGTLVTLLCRMEDSAKFQQFLFQQTSTLGIRIRHDRRVLLDRRVVPVATPYGPVRVKIGSFGGQACNAAPEYEDCRAAAEQHAVALKEVQMAALQAFRNLEDEAS